MDRAESSSEIMKAHHEARQHENVIQANFDTAKAKYMLELLDLHGDSLGVEINIGGQVLGLSNSKDMIPVIKAHMNESIKASEGKDNKWE